MSEDCLRRIVKPQWIHGYVQHITINRNCEEADDAG